MSNQNKTLNPTSLLKQYKKVTTASFSSEDIAYKEFLEVFRKTNFINSSLLFPVDFYGKQILCPALTLANSLYPSNVWISERDVIEQKWLVDVNATPIPSPSVGGNRIYWNYYYNISDIKNMYSSSDAVSRTPMDKESSLKLVKQIVTDFDFDFEISSKPTECISSEYRLFTDMFLYRINKNEVFRGTFHLLYNSCVVRKRTKVIFNADLIEHFFAMILATHFGISLEVNDRIRSNEWLRINPKEYMNAYNLAWALLEQVAYDSQIVSDTLEFEDGFVRTKPLSYHS